MPPRRVSLPGADELFRTTGGMALSPSLGSRAPQEPADGAKQQEEPSADAPAQRVPAGRGPVGAPAQGGGGPVGGPGASHGRPGQPGRPAVTITPQPSSPAGEDQAGEQAGRRRTRVRAPRRPSGRERHDEKITVYVSAEELMDLEHARLVLRGEHGLAVDRGRVVREAIAVVLADLEQRGEASILVRRLRGR